MNKQIERRYDMDWLRFLAMCAVFFFHCARFFDYGGWHVKNAEQAFGMQVFVSVTAQWLMPLFFVLAGMSSFYSLAVRESGGFFLRERVKRLLVPFVFAIFTMIPLQVYDERVSHGNFQGTLLEFYPHYFDGFYAFGGNFAWMGLHLWFLLFLFVFTLLTLPLFLYLRQKSGLVLITWLGAIFSRPGLPFLFCLPAVFCDFFFLPGIGPGIRDMGGWNLFTYMALFISGYILAADDRFRQSLEKHRRVALVLGVISLAIMYYWSVHVHEPRPGYTLWYFLFALGRTFNSWCLLLVCLGYGSRYLGFTNQVLRYGTPLVMPFYILHQTVLIGIGFFVVQWEAGIAVKYLVIGGSALTLIMVLYEGLIRRIGLLRFLFGMKSVRR